MSALARYFVADNKNVAGYDKTQTEITNELEKLNIKIHFEDDVKNIEERYLNPKDTLIVYTPAIPKNHREWTYFINNGFKILKRSQVLGLITENTTCFAVAGTHGKTTITSILGHLLKECEVEVIAFLGGISENFNSNLILQSRAGTPAQRIGCPTGPSRPGSSPRRRSRRWIASRPIP